MIDIGIGAGGSEVVIIPDFLIRGDSNLDNFTPVMTPALGFQVPSGTRIAARAQCSHTIAVDRVITTALYGLV